MKQLVNNILSDIIPLDYNWQFDTVKFIYCLLNELKPRTKTELNAIISSVIKMRCTKFTIEMYADAIHGRSVIIYVILLIVLILEV